MGPSVRPFEVSWVIEIDSESGRPHAETGRLECLKRSGKVISKLKRKHRQDDIDREERERRHQEKALDEALKNTFPASDPVSVEQPTPPAADRDRAKT